MIAYTLWALRPFWISGPLTFDDDVPEDARIALTEWYRENRDFGRVTPSVRGFRYFLANPFEKSILPTNVAFYDGLHGPEVSIYYRGNSQDFDLCDGQWLAEDFQIRDSANYSHPSRPSEFHGFFAW